METFNFTVLAYYIYIPLTVLLTMVVAHHLFKNGLIYMMDIFSGRKEIAVSTNQLFKTGFYLLNLGFALLIMKVYSVLNTQDLIEVLAQKVGGFSIYLGLVLFLNLFMFFRGKKVARQNRLNRELQNQSISHES